MVLHKRLDYGSSGYQVLPMPRVPRSARGKRSIRKKVVYDKRISAFDLLATVAVDLLSERENSPPPSKISEIIKKEKQENEISLQAEAFDQGSCNESTLGFESVFKRQAGYTLKDECKIELGIKTPIQVFDQGSCNESTLDSESVFKRQPGCTLKDECKLELGIKTLIQAERRTKGNAMDENITVIPEDPMDLDVKPPCLVSSDGSVEVPISRNRLFPKIKDEMGLVVDRDNDENSFAGTHPSTKTAKPFRPQRIGDRRIRKLLASKFWRVPQTAFKEGELSNTDAEMKHIYRSRKMFYMRQRTQRSSFRRRKLFELCAMPDISTSLKFFGSKTKRSAAHASFSGAKGASSSDKKSLYESGDYNVKFSIKSFKVPELFIEIPENATVGSLKRTVMEAATAILSSGLRVGVLLQGKKVMDEKQTLIQAGISSNDDIENLGFTLEPNSTQPSPQSVSLTCSEDPKSLLPSASTEPIQRMQAIVPAIDQESTQTSVLSSANSDDDSALSHNGAKPSVDKMDNLKALVPVAGTTARPLSMVPLQKSRRSELAQRRIRRPFSVLEVEALVQAVEKLGTGRWRDVKIRAFDNAKHRTYVDLKDKWKTLVHTARISPQQRRGEPVPQDLLDRVLSAHAYWSKQKSEIAG